MKKNKYDIAIQQPLPMELKPFLPVNFFLFVKFPDKGSSKIRKVKSSFHSTNELKLITFYKSISNIL